jgi:hypothetical protein
MPHALVFAYQSRVRRPSTLLPLLRRRLEFDFGGVLFRTLITNELHGHEFSARCHSL